MSFQIGKLHLTQFLLKKSFVRRRLLKRLPSHLYSLFHVFFHFIVIIYVSHSFSPHPSIFINYASESSTFFWFFSPHISFPSLHLLYSITKPFLVDLPVHLFFFFTPRAFISRFHLLYQRISLPHCTTSTGEFLERSPRPTSQPTNSLLVVPKTRPSNHFAII